MNLSIGLMPFDILLGVAPTTAFVLNTSVAYDSYWVQTGIDVVHVSISLYFRIRVIGLIVYSVNE
jgi:hypothetical protein